MGGTPIVDDDGPSGATATVTGRMGGTGGTETEMGPVLEEGKFPGATGLRYTQTIMPGTRSWDYWRGRNACIGTIEDACH